MAEPTPDPARLAPSDIPAVPQSEAATPSNLSVMEEKEKDFDNQSDEVQEKKTGGMSGLEKVLSKASIADHTIPAMRLAFIVIALALSVFLVSFTSAKIPFLSIANAIHRSPLI